MSLIKQTIHFGITAIFLSLIFESGAAKTDVVRDDDFKTLQQGKFDGVALSSDGFLFPAEARERLGDTGTEIVWAVIDQGEKGILCATGHDGKLVRIDREGNIHELGAAAESELTAMLELPDGSVLIAAAPGGQIYRFSTDDVIEPYIKLEAKFIWDLARDQDGNIWAATGTEGRLFKIRTQRGKAELEGSVKLPSKNLIDLWTDDNGLMGPSGQVYIAGESPGYLYRYHGGTDFEVLYDAQSDEIRAIEATPDGLLVATNTERAPSPQALNLTLRMSGAALQSEGMEAAPPGGGQNGAEQDMGDVFGKPKPQQQQNPISKVLLLRPDGYAEGIWRSPERPIHALRSMKDGSILVAAGGRGRLFKVFEDYKFALISDTDEDYLLGLHPVEAGWLVHGARNGVVYQVRQEAEPESVYESRVIGGGGPVRWGKFYWRGERGADQHVRVSFRLGNAKDPNQGSWEDWSREQSVRSGVGVSLPAGPSRFMQYRLRMVTDAEQAEHLRTDYIETFYMAENRPPNLRNIRISEMTPPTEGGGNGNGNGNQQGQQNPNNATKQPQAGGRKPHSNTGTVQVTWNAVDANNDDLEYSIYFKAEDESAWKLIEEEFRQTNIPLGLKGVADGRYRFRVVVSDRLSNPPGTELTDEIVSGEYTIDNTPPTIHRLKTEVDGNKVHLSLEVEDATSLISSVEIDIDNDEAYPLFPKDRLYDDRIESIAWTSNSLEPGQHVLTVAITDRQGNTQIGKAVFTIP